MATYGNSPMQNDLEQWMAFYDRHMRRRPVNRSAGGMSGFSGGFVGGGDFSGMDDKERMDFALARTGMTPQAGQAPDFFADDGMGGGAGGGMPQAKFVRPERFNDPMPERQSFASPMRGDIENYLAKFLRGR